MKKQLTLLVILLMLSGCQINQTSEVIKTPPALTDEVTNDSPEEPAIVEPTIRESVYRLYFFNPTELSFYYVDATLPVEDKAIITALTKALQRTDIADDFLALTDRIGVRSAKVDDDGVLTIVFSESFIDHMNLGTNTESGLVTSMLATYGTNLGVDKITIYFNDELYTSLKGELDEGHFEVKIPNAKEFKMQSK